MDLNEADVWNLDLDRRTSEWKVEQPLISDSFIEFEKDKIKDNVKNSNSLLSYI